MRYLVLIPLLVALPAGARAADVQFSVDDSRERHPISPFIYGTNQPDWQGTAKHLTLTRLGGNRWTAYNWENNASNAGNDWHFQNDGFLGGGETPGEAVRPHVAAALQAGAAVVVTVPMAGYVSADKKGDGDQRKAPDYLKTRFFESRPRKGAAFAYPPDTADRVVYQDEFVAWLEKTFRQGAGPARRLFYSLDNEPDLWDNTHAEVRTAKLTYQEILTRSVEYGAAIKDAAPGALLFGPASYGWYGYERLQGAPDHANRNFLEFYLAGMRTAERAQGRRLLDALDVHWYPEARGGGKRITEGDNGPECVKARLQAPRSLWDPTYQEDSWICRDALHQPIRLIPRLKEKIAAHYPGTRLAITEYNYGGGGHISGALAQADVLGIFGREGVFAAALWSLGRNEAFTYAGFALYRDFDGSGGRFGDTSVHAQTNDVERTSVYAGVDAANPTRMVVVAVNKSDAPVTAALTVASPARFTRASVYRVTADGPAPRPDGELRAVGANRFSVPLPAMSAATLLLSAR